MPRIRLTDATLRSLSCVTRTDFWDASLPSFGIRVGAQAKTFIVKHSNSRHAIGQYPEISLHEARRRAVLFKGEKRDTTSRLTVKDTTELFLTTQCADYRKRSLYEAKRLLKKISSLSKKLTGDITTNELTAIIDKQSPSEAVHLFKILRTLFRFAVRRRIILSSPLYALPLPRREKARSHVLSDDELRRVWEAATESGMFGIIVKVLILTGQRRGEIAALRPEFFKDGICTLPGTLTKNRREHSFPVGALCATVLASGQGREPAALLFPARGEPEHAFNGWSKSKRKLDELSGVHDWTLHDLRRTFATNLAALAVPPHITERLLNHATGTISGVAAIYNRFPYMDEMRAAIALWEERLASLLAQHGLADLPRRMMHHEAPCASCG